MSIGGILDLSGVYAPRGLTLDPTAQAEAFTAPGGAAAALAAADIYSLNRFSTFASGTVGAAEVGTRPANGAYNELWTRDHAYVAWHQPRLFSSAQLRGFITRRLATRSTSSTPDPDGGFLPPNFICDRINNVGVVTFKNAGTSKLPFLDGIHFVVLALWADWRETGDSSFFAANKTVIDACLAAIPRSPSGNGCVWSDPSGSNSSVDYGFTDGVRKTGDCAYSTALQAWTYKMLAEISGEVGSGAYTTLRAAAEAGLATLRKSTGWYAGSSVNNLNVDDVWATALIVAEGLCPMADRIASAVAIAKAYSAGTITQRGWVRHLPVGQFWSGTGIAQGEYQNGGYWATPLWDCVRAVCLVNPGLARQWVNEAVAEYRAQVAAEGTVGADTAPYEWFNGAVLSTPKGYTASAALLARLADTSTAYRTTTVGTAGVNDTFTADTSASYTLSAFSYDGANHRMKANGAADGEHFVHATYSQADVAVIASAVFSAADNWPGLILRYTDANNYIFCALGGFGNDLLAIYDRVAGANTNIGFLVFSGGVPAAGTLYEYAAWAVGTTVKFRAFGQETSGTTTITGAGKVGCRHGRTGAGFTAYDTLAAYPLAAGTVPADVLLAHDGGLITPGGSTARPLFGQYRLLDAAGRVLRRGTAGGAPVAVA